MRHGNGPAQDGALKLLSSPVFYLGLALVLVVVAALLAPFVIDWNGYRSDLERWGEKLTGRQVAIRGDIAVRLFPFPQLTADDVSIANPDGFREPIFASINQVKVQITLGGLINGDLQVEAIELNSPTVTLLRAPDDKVNWTFDPAGSVRNSPLLNNVLLDQIRVIGGHAYFLDDLRTSRVELTDIQATVSAPTLAGPWRSKGSFNRNGSSADFSLSTSTWDSGKPLSFSLRLSPEDGAGYSMVVDAETSAGGLRGTVSASPVLDAEGKGNTEGELRQVTFNSEFEADFRHLELSKIEIRPADTRDQGTLIAGKASADIGQVINAKVNISAPRIDLDALAGAGSRRLLRDGGGLALINSLLNSLPPDAELEAAIEVLALKAGGETLENTKAQFKANRQQITIDKLTTSLPGRSRLLFQGMFFPGERVAELSGKLSLETFDARQLVGWVAQESKESIAKVWTGNRGHFKSESDVRLTSSKLEFSNANYELNGDAGTGRIAMLVNGERPILDVSLQAQRLDVDSFFPSGPGLALATDNSLTWVWLLQNFVEEQSRRDLNLMVTADKLVLNGVEAQGLTAQIETTVRGFDLKSFELASVGGAKIKASGLIINSDAGADGDIEARVLADDPRKLLRLIGLVPRDREVSWAQALGKTDFGVKLSARAGQSPGTLGVTAQGSSGEFTFAYDGSIAAAQTATPRLTGTAEVAAARSGALWQLLGGAVQPADEFPASLKLSLEGDTLSGLKAVSAVQLYGSTFGFEGALKLADGWTLQGAVTAMGGDVRPLLGVVGLPMMSGFGNAALSLSVKAELQANAAALNLANISGEWNGGPISGSFQLAEGRKIRGDIIVQRLSIAQAMAMAFLPWSEQANFQSLFAETLPGGATGELWLRPKELEVYPGYLVGDGQIGITGAAGRTQVAVYGKGSQGEKVSVDVTLDATSPQRKVSGKLSLPFDLARSLSQTDRQQPVAGVASIDLSFTSEGLSPAAALAMANGTGSFNLLGAVLKGISPDRFTATIQNAKTPSDLQSSLDAMAEGTGISMQPSFGAITIANGVATVTPFTVKTPDADVSVSTSADLPNGILDIAVTLSLKALPDLPPMNVVYRGPPQALERSNQAGDLAAFLGFKVLNQSVAELERVQAEQQRLAREEEELRKQDEQKLAMFNAQRAELRLRQREARIWSGERISAAGRDQARLQAIVLISKSINAAELTRRSRELQAQSVDAH